VQLSFASRSLPHYIPFISISMISRGGVKINLVIKLDLWSWIPCWKLVPMRLYWSQLCSWFYKKITEALASIWKQQCYSDIASIFKYVSTLKLNCMFLHYWSIINDPTRSTDGPYPCPTLCEAHKRTFSYRPIGGLYKKFKMGPTQARKVIKGLSDIATTRDQKLGYLSIF